MKYLLLILMIVSFFYKGNAQKPSLNLDSYKSWPEVNEGHLSNDGKFAFYQVYTNNPLRDNKVVIKSTSSSWEIEVSKAEDLNFSDDNQYIVGKLPNDTLFILNLHTGKVSKTGGQRDYRLFKQDKKEMLLLSDTSMNLTLRAFDGSKGLTFPNVLQYEMSPDGKNVLLKQNSSNKNETITWVDLVKNAKTTIYQGEGANSFIFDDKSQQIAFLVKTINGNAIWYYKIGINKAILLVDNQTVKINDSLKIQKGQFWRFSKDGERLFFSLEDKPVVDPSDKTNLDIWSYQDAYLKSHYYSKGLPLSFNTYPRQFLSVLILKDQKIKQLVNGIQQVVSGSFRHETDDFFLIRSSFGSNDEWNTSSFNSYYICSTKTGELKPIELDQVHTLSHLSISPTGKYIIYYNVKLKNYCSYEIATTRKRVITYDENNNWIRYGRKEYPKPENFAIGLAGWLKDDNAVLIYGTYDIWQVDPSGEKPPVNLTEGKGESGQIVFHVQGESSNGIIGLDDKLLLSAFEQKTKKFGFYRIKLATKPIIEKLYMGAKTSGDDQDGYARLSTNELSKAKFAGNYIIQLQSATQAPNYFVTHDFKNYTPLSDIQPQKAYNWLTTELHEYKDSLGNSYQGVLYKPENFDSTKKYPIAFHYYVEMSYLLNSFVGAKLAPADFTISQLVSNGYLVFLPDIHSKIRYSGEGALRSVLAAVDHLSQYPWIDTSKMAIAGSSHGGFETNYIVTHTNRFAAAISGFGISDLISFASGTWGWGEGQQSFTEISQKMEVPLSEDPEAYIRNSPILHAKGMQTPLLLLHNDMDTQSSYLQSRSFFIVLRDLQKKVWWLNYKGEGHGVEKTASYIDYNRRVMEFLDHYLKNKPMPDWMTRHLSSTNR